MRHKPSFSIVINTDGRSESLRVTLESLCYLDYPAFEICVVRGPTEDGTTGLLERWCGRVKVAGCPERNLSVSRNIGIAMAAGEIVAFIDDDAVPEAEWLRDLSSAFEDPAAAGAGGIVYDHTGARPQYLYSSANRLGRADWEHKTPPAACNFPLSDNFPYLQGTNCAFRRSILEQIGGFDEEYEFYLDETDLCCRLVDRGFLLRQLPGAIVHHKFLPCAIRNEYRVARHRYSIIKNKIYFSLINNRGHYTLDTVVRDAVAFIDEHERDVRFHIEGGRLSWDDLESFSKDVGRAWATGLTRGLDGKRRLLRPETLARHRSPFLAFSGSKPPRRRTYCFITSEYPPGRIGGIARYTEQLAHSIAALGHHVHVLTPGIGYDRVDFEKEVWVHRILPENASLPESPRDLRVPPHIWSHSERMLAEIESIARKRNIECIYAPIWDCGGLATLLDRRFPLITGLQTTLHFWLQSHSHRLSDKAYMTEFGTPMLALESRMLKESDGIHAISRAIAADISTAYGIDLSSSRTAVIPLGLEDWRGLPAALPPSLPEGGLRVLFVGRLEARKGIDVLLEAMQHLMPRYPQLYLDVVGNDKLPAAEGVTYREAFESNESARTIAMRVCFHGEVDEKALRGFYRACDIFVAPSRYESFGLVLVEAMMFAKPVVACRAGGVVEIIEDGLNGLMAEPGNIDSLCERLERLINDPALRARLGRAGRSRYEEKFTPARMTSAVIAFFDQVAAAHDGIRFQSEIMDAGK